MSLLNSLALDDIKQIEKGEEGIRVTFKNGEMKFIGGDVGFELYRKWNGMMEIEDEP